MSSLRELVRGRYLGRVDHMAKVAGRWVDLGQLEQKVPAGGRGVPSVVSL